MNFYQLTNHPQPVNSTTTFLPSGRESTLSFVNETHTHSDNKAAARVEIIPMKKKCKLTRRILTNDTHADVRRSKGKEVAWRLTFWGQSSCSFVISVLSFFLRHLFTYPFPQTIDTAVARLFDIPELVNAIASHLEKSVLTILVLTCRQFKILFEP